MKKILFAVLLQVFSTALVFGQFETPESRMVSLVKSKTLLVALKEEDTRTLLTLQKKPGDLEKYKQAIAAQNEMLQRTVEKYWDFSKKMEFMPESKVKIEIEEGNTRYAVLLFERRDGELIDQFKYMDVYDGPYTSDTRQIAREAGYGIYKLIIPGKQGAEEAYHVQIPVAYPSEGDMIFTIQLMQHVLKAFQKTRDYKIQEFETEVAANNAELKKKTLLIDKYQVASKTNQDDFNKNYPYPVEIADYEQINALIIEQDPSYAYIQIIPYGLPSTKVDRSKIGMEIMHLVADCEGGRILATCKPTRLSYDKVANDISKKEIKEYVKTK